MQKLQTQHLTRAAAVGAAYAVLSLFIAEEEIP